MSHQNADISTASTEHRLASNGDGNVTHNENIAPSNDTMTTAMNRQYDPVLMNLVKDFFNAQFELKKAQCPFPNLNLTNLTTSTNTNNQLLVNFDKVRVALRALGKSFEIKYERKLFDIIIKLDLQPQNSRATFQSLSNEMFVQGIQWNHIITYFVFSVDFAFYSSQRGTATVSDVAQWLTRYTSEHLVPWIENNGGWVGIVNFARNTVGTNISIERLFDIDFKNFLCGAVGALGVLSLGLFLSSR